MATYLISAHGGTNWNQATTVPMNITVLFYQPFGRPMDNDVGLVLQAALANPRDPRSPQVLQQYPTTALWNAGDHRPYISLTADRDGLFHAGIVNVETNQVVYRINPGALISLSWALNFISERERGQHVNVHCLFCL